MTQGMDFEGETFLEPGLELLIGWIDGGRHDADGSTAIDLFEAIENRAEELLPFGWCVHVVDGEDDDGLDTGFADPLWSSQLWKIAANIKRIGFAEIGEAIGVVMSRGRDRG